VITSGVLNRPRMALNVTRYVRDARVEIQGGGAAQSLAWRADGGLAHVRIILGVGLGVQREWGGLGHAPERLQAAISYPELYDR